MAKVFKKHLCRACRRWYRRAGTCQCGEALRERRGYSLDYRDATGKRRIEDLPTTYKRAAQSELVSRLRKARRG